MKHIQIKNNKTSNFKKFSKKKSIFSSRKSSAQNFLSEHVPNQLRAAAATLLCVAHGEASFFS
jgi:hypothetical protein